MSNYLSKENLKDGAYVVFFLNMNLESWFTPIIKKYLHLR